MSKRAISHVLMLALMACIALVAPDTARAQAMATKDPASGSVTTGPAGAPVTLVARTPGDRNGNGIIEPGEFVVDAICPSPQNTNFGFTERIIRCVEATVNTGATAMVNGIYTLLRPATFAAIVLAFTAFGGAILIGGVRNPTKSTAMLVFRTAFIFYFMVSYMDVFNGTMGAMQGSLAWASSLMDRSPSFYCPAINPGAITDKTLWARIDCAFGSILGAAPGMMVKMGIIGLLAALMFTGAVGFTIFVLGFIFIGTLLMSIVRAVHIYIVSYVGVSLMMAFSPLFVPMMLFRSTRAMFDKWLKLTMALALQPLFLFMYLGMVLVTFDTLVYRSSTSFYGMIAGSQMGCQLSAAGCPQYTCPSPDNPGDTRFCLTRFMEVNQMLTNHLSLGMLIDLAPDQAPPTATSPTTNTGLLGNIWSEFKGKVGDAFSSVSAAALESLGALSIKIPINILDLDQVKNARGEASITWPGGITYDYAYAKSFPQPQSITDFAVKNGIAGGAAEWRWNMTYNLLMQIFLCAMMGYVMYAILKYIPDLSHNMVGSVFNTPNLYNVSPL